MSGPASSDGSRGRYVVSPAAGGGVTAWAAALARKLASVAAAHGHAVVVVAPLDRPARYAQALLCGCGLHVETVSNAYLTGAERLEDRDEAALRALGWRAPGDETENWWCQLDGAAEAGWRALVPVGELVLATLVEVHGVSEADPLELEVFPADCRDCRQRARRVGAA